MNLNELNSYRLSDAVKFNDGLNPRIWGQDEQMLPQIRDSLLKIAQDFEEFLGISDVEVKDITISGSNAAYTYTDHSDIDLHLVVDLPEADRSEVYRELFDAKKYQYNDLHNIKIGGHDVELYVQNANETHHSQGIYSVLNDQWVSVPQRRQARVDDECVRSKYQDLAARIDQAIKTQEHDGLATLMKKIKTMRQSGLEKTGEFSPENLAFKMLRTQGFIDRLVQARNAARDQQLSLDERRKKPKKKKRVQYAYGGYWFPGTAYAGQDHAAGAEGGGGESINESVDTTEILKTCFKDIVKDLGIQQIPKMILHSGSKWRTENGSFGQYRPHDNVLHLAVGDRHVMDMIRTMAHELTHCRQNEINQLPGHAGETGSPWEDEANAMAGRILRGIADRYPKLFAPGAVAESSGYIPTKREKNDPRFKMALSPDVQPGATGLNANRMGLKTGPQGEPTLLMKGLRNALREFKETGQLPLTEDQDLFEINMSPSNLKKLVRDIDARAGIEFEMIVPDINVEDEGELEQDMDQDERVSDIDDVIRFFDDGDYNSARDIRNLREEMYGAYEEWRNEQVDEQWAKQGRDWVRDWIFNNDLFDRDEAMATARDQIIDANPDMPVDSDEFQDLVSNRVDELADDFASDAWANQDNGYDDAREAFVEEQSDDVDEEDWLRSEGIRYASDVSSNYDIAWPHYTTIGGDAKMDIDSVAEDFSRAIGRPVNASDRYHGGRREAGHYVVEPDSSLDPDDSSDGGLEFVSPPLPLDELLSDLEKVRAWAKRRGCYTNDSTGLHMNVSVPDTSTAKLDYVKLAVLLGDERVLNEFGRAANTYAASAMGKIRDILKNKPQAATEVLEKMRGHMEALATKVIHTGETSKYTSINTKGNYVEFRSPGGDYLDANWELVVPTLMRTVVALDAAMDPAKYRQEYQKKLYKLLDSSKQRSASPSVNKLLSMYFASDDEANSREVAVKLAKEILSRKDLEKQVGTPGKQFWWSVQKGNDRIEVVAGTEGVALDVAAEQWGLSGADRMPNATATILRPYVEPPAQTDDGRWGIWISDADKFTVGDGKIRRWASKDDAELWLKLRRESKPNTRADLEVREIPDDYQQSGRVETDQQPEYYVHTGVYNTSSFRAPSRAAAIDHFRRNWNQTGTFQLRTSTGEVIYDPAQDQEYEVFDTDTDDTVYRFTAADYDAATRGGLEDYRTMGPHGLTPQQAAQRYDLRRAGPRYFIHDRGANRFIHQFFAPTLDTAERELTQWETRSPGANLGLVRPADLEAYPALAALAAEYSNRSRTQEPSSDRDDLAPREPGNTQGSNNGNWGVWTPRRERFVTIGASTRRFNTEADAEAWIQDYNTREPHNDLELTARRLQSPSAALSAPQSWYVSVIGQPDTEIEIQSAADSDDATRQAQVARPGVFAAETGNIRAARVPVGAALPDLFPDIPRAPAAEPDFSQMGSNTTGRHRYQIIRMSDRRQVGEFNADTQAEAELHAHMVLGNAGLDSADYDVRQAPSAASAQGEFTGEWKIVSPNGEEIHRFGGVGNVQADANRVATEWLRRNPGRMQAGVEVVPVMSE